MGSDKTQEVIIETRQCTKRFGSVLALDRLDLKLKSGVVALLGPNGAGKTTLLKILLGLIKPTYGSSSVLGFDSQRDSLSVRKHVSILHEKPQFPKTFTPYRFLQLVGRIYELDSIEEKIEEMLKLVKLWEDRERMIGHLSAGMIQRLGLAQALLPHPSLIFLDEPTANLDPIGRVTILNIVREFARNYGISFLISSHILADLERVCDSLAIINQGQLLLEGRIQHFFTREQSSVISIKSFHDNLEEVVKEFPGVEKVHRIDNVSVEVNVNDVLAFESALLKLMTEEKIRIENFKIENNLERLYIQTITTFEQEIE